MVAVMSPGPLVPVHMTWMLTPTDSPPPGHLLVRCHRCGARLAARNTECDKYPALHPHICSFCQQDLNNRPPAKLTTTSMTPARVAPTPMKLTRRQRKRMEKPMHTITFTVQTLQLDDNQWMAYTKVGGVNLRGTIGGNETVAIQALFRDMGLNSPTHAGEDTALALALLVGRKRGDGPLPELPEATVE